MARVVLIIGDTGTGKSRSIKNLNPDETYVINVLGKDLPFKGYQKLYNREKKNIKTEINWDNIRTMLPQVAEKGYKNIIIDDARHIMENEFIARAGEQNWSKFVDFAQQMISVITSAKNCGNDETTVFIMFHIDDIYSGQAKTGMKIKLVGKFVEEHFNPLEIVSICLVTHVKTDKDGKTKYYFVTNKTVIGGVEYIAKSPEEMFESLLIENDLELVRNSLTKYYKGE